MFESRISNYQKARVMDVWRNRIDLENEGSESTSSDQDFTPSGRTSRNDMFRLDAEF